MSASRAARPPVEHPLMLRHPYTGETCLYADPGYTTEIIGLPEDESARVLEFLFAHETRDEFIYRHKWRRYDMLIWDNCATIHMATGGYRPDEPRHMMRTQIKVDEGRM